MKELLELARRVVEDLQHKDLHITTVESCTGGGLANMITNVEGSSEVIQTAIVTYCDDAKVALGVPNKILKKYSVYSEETAIEMAKAGVRKARKIGIKSEVEVGVGITGLISGHDRDYPDAEPGDIYVGVVFRKKIRSEYFPLKEGERWKIKNEIIKKAFIMVDEVINEDQNSNKTK